MSIITRETFFLPKEVEREKWSAPAETYNIYRSLLKRCTMGHVFVPIRNLQFMAVLDINEIVFIDSLSYAYSNNKGGRLILVAWSFASTQDREALTQPVPCEVIFYKKYDPDLQLRLVTEFRKALEQMDQRYRNEELPAKGAKILNL